MIAFTLPDLGEGLQDAELVEWLIKEGDRIHQDQVVVLVETAKALVELPAPANGIVTKLAIRSGATVKVGETLFEYDSLAQVAPKQRNTTSDSQQTGSISVVGKLAQVTDDKANLFEQQEEGLSKTAEKLSSLNTPQTSVTAQKDVKQSLNPICINAFKESKRTKVAKETKAQLINPSVMAFAKKLGVQGRLVSEQFQDCSMLDIFNLYLSEQEFSTGSGAKDTEIIPLRGFRKTMATEMSKAHQQVPAVTLFEDADVSHWTNKEDITVRMIAAISHACQHVPLLNAWFDQDKATLELYKSVNLGLAVDSEDGLFVPTILSVNEKSQAQLRKEITQLKTSVQCRQIKKEQMTGATISLSNFGGLSGKYATPIIVPPQVCIVGVGKLRESAVVSHGKLIAGKILPLSVSFDHRIATGAEAAKFLAIIIEDLAKQ